MCVHVCVCVCVSHQVPLKSTWTVLWVHRMLDCLINQTHLPQKEKKITDPTCESFGSTYTIVDEWECFEEIIHKLCEMDYLYKKGHVWENNWQYVQCTRERTDCFWVLISCESECTCWSEEVCCCRSRLWLPFHCVPSYYTISITPNVCVTHLSLPCFLPQAKNSSHTWIRFGERVSPPRPKPGQQDCRDGRWQECSGHRNIFHWYEGLRLLSIIVG